jgi:hypothetical protein
VLVAEDEALVLMSTAANSNYHSYEITRDMHPTRRTRIHPKGLQSPLQGRLLHRGAETNKGSICRYNMLDSFSRPLLFEHRKRLTGASTWKVCSANYFALLCLRGKAVRTCKKYRN